MLRTSAPRVGARTASAWTCESRREVRLFCNGSLGAGLAYQLDGRGHRRGTRHSDATRRIVGAVSVPQIVDRAFSGDLL
jgi:hypothetical protein